MKVMVRCSHDSGTANTLKHCRYLLPTQNTRNGLYILPSRRLQPCSGTHVCHCKLSNQDVPHFSTCFVPTQYFWRTCTRWRMQVGWTSNRLLTDDGRVDELKLKNVSVGDGWNAEVSSVDPLVLLTYSGTHTHTQPLQRCIYLHKDKRHGGRGRGGSVLHHHCVRMRNLNYTF